MSHSSYEKMMITGEPEFCDEELVSTGKYCIVREFEVIGYDGISFGTEISYMHPSDDGKFNWHGNMEDCLEYTMEDALKVVEDLKARHKDGVDEGRLVFNIEEIYG